jgi:hypothetical protein
MHYEYKVVPAPSKAPKAQGVKGTEARFAHGLETLMNTYAADGWQYQRADILPSEERKGFTSSQTVYRTVLVFRRPVGSAVPDAMPEVAAPVAEPEMSEVSAPDVTAPSARSARFSLLGPARAEEDGQAPPLAAPHVDRDETNWDTETQEHVDESEDRR